MDNLPNPQPRLLYDGIQSKASNNTCTVVFPLIIDFLSRPTAAPPGIIVIHRPLGHLEAHYMHENTVGTELGAQIH